jgi:hypothetical protein
MDFKPTDASLNRMTYSSYYGGNVAKGGVFLQLCGWLGVHSLWVGAVSDTKYLSESGILELQQEFVENDETSDLSDIYEHCGQGISLCNCCMEEGTVPVAANICKE